MADHKNNTQIAIKYIVRDREREQREQSEKKGESLAFPAPGTRHRALRLPTATAASSAALAAGDLSMLRSHYIISRKQGHFGMGWDCGALRFSGLLLLVCCRIRAQYVGYMFLMRR